MVHLQMSWTETLAYDNAACAIPENQAVKSAHMPVKALLTIMQAT